jgi:hypothetical protein
MKRAQKDYDLTFTELRETENEYYDLLREVVLSDESRTSSRPTLQGKKTNCTTKSTF